MKKNFGCVGFIVLFLVCGVLAALGNTNKTDRATQTRARLNAMWSVTATAEVVSGMDEYGYPMGTGEVDCRGLIGRDAKTSVGLGSTFVNCLSHDSKLYNSWDKHPELAAPGYWGGDALGAARQACIRNSIQENGGQVPDSSSPQSMACAAIIPHP